MSLLPPSRGRHRRPPAVWWLALCLLFHFPAASPAADLTEYDVKAAFLYRLTLFMEWPPSRFASEKDPLSLGIVGTDPFGSSIDKVLKDQKVGDRQIKIQRLALTATNTHTSAHILFLSSALAPETEKLVLNVRTLPVLTVGEAEDFTRNGGHVRLYLQENKLRFEINVAALERSGLKLHSQVMKLATRVTRDGKDVKQ
jgi:hypothetical protein